jgi:hypothetical protein
VNGQSVKVVAALALLLVACAPSPSASLSSPSESAGISPGPSGGRSAAPPAAVAEWSQSLAGGPAPAAREDHTWTVTPDGSFAYLFGGRDGATVFDDLWAYDLAAGTWSQVSDAGSGPPARFGHNAAWAEGIGLVVFGGQAGADFFNDLWAYDPAANAWRPLPAGGARPVARYGSCAAIGLDARMWISHGFTSEGQRFADTWAYDFGINAWTDETPVGEAPVRRCLHACWWTDDGGLILYAGQTTGITALGDLWRLMVGERPGTNTWTELQPSGESPADRNLYAAAHWGPGTLVFGGQGLDGEYLADTWWLADDGTSTQPPDTDGVAPSPRAGSEMIADTERERLLLFGGRDGEAVFGDLWQLAPSPLP